ncbi:MAG: LysE family translocator [Pseudomonadota bacterium]
MAPPDWSILAALTLLWIVIVPTPGANALMITHVALTRPRGHVSAALFGNQLAFFVMASAAVLGLSLLLDTFPWLRRAIYVAGGLYLIYFGLRLLWAARTTPTSGTAGLQPDGSDEPPPVARGKAAAAGPTRYGSWLLGVATALSNAQAVFFITSIFAVTGVLKSDLLTQALCVLIMVTSNALYLAALGWLFRRAQVRAAYARFKRPFQSTVGALFVLFGGQLTWRGWTA